MLLLRKPLRIGTRGSKLALKQTEIVASILRSKGLFTETVIIKTSGDRFANKPLYTAGGKGLFVREIEEQLLAGSIEIAVHSLKDMSVFEDSRFSFFTLKRDYPEDTIIYREGKIINRNTVIGTSSLRRQAEVLRTFGEVTFTPIRGNLDTRIKKLKNGEADALVVSKAGLMRLNLYNSATMEDLNIVPAASQGVIAVECLSSKAELIELLKDIEDKETRLCTDMERKFVRELNANCNYPIGAHCSFSGELFTMKVMYGFPEDLSKTVHHKHEGHNPEKVCQECIEHIRRSL